MKIRSPNGESYLVGELIGKAPVFRIYLCEHVESKRQCLLQIATDTSNNGLLDRLAFRLQGLKRASEDREKEFEPHREHAKHRLNFDIGFPELIDSFVSQDQEGRRVNVLGFKFVEKVSQMVPIGRMLTKDRLCVDLRTSAWMMGKLLKVLVFAHSEEIEIGELSTNNVLLEPKEHFVSVFDWAASKRHAGGVPYEIACGEVAQVARIIITALGGDSEKPMIPDYGNYMFLPGVDDNEGFRRYTTFIYSIARGEEESASRAHRRFYALVDQLWKREYYSFHTHTLS